MKKVLITGATGGLGKQVFELMSNDYEITSVGSKDFDIKNINQCEEFFKNKNFDVVINFAGLKPTIFCEQYTLLEPELVSTLSY
jgi:dTDP-4-dehydrorhamnose reductase